MPSEVRSDEGDGSLRARRMRVKRADRPCSVLMNEALSSDEPTGEATRRCLVAGGRPQDGFEPTFAYLKVC